MKRTPRTLPFCFVLVLSLFLTGCSSEDTSLNLPVTQGDHIALIGNNLCSRMMNYGHFETEMHLRYPTQKLFIRNMGDGGNTPGFRPHSGRYSPWAFQGAEKFQTELANFSNSQGILKRLISGLRGWKRILSSLSLAIMNRSQALKDSLISKKS